MPSSAQHTGNPAWQTSKAKTVLSQVVWWHHLSISMACRPSSAQHTGNPAWKTSFIKNVHSKIVCWHHLSIDAQPRGGNRQTAKGFCILYSFFRFVVEHFESVYQLRMRVYLCTNLGVHKDQL
jgi:hypothetical protein